MSIRSESRVQRWEHLTGLPLTVFALVFVALYAIPILRPDLPDHTHLLFEYADLTIWAMFGIDYTVRLLLSENRRAFVRHHLFDLAVLVLPLLRPLRVLRLITALSVLNRHAESWTRGRLAVYIGGATATVILIGGLAILDAERANPDANITSYQDALWWSVTTITTVGYGDHYPTTASGQFVALVLMISGIGLIGFVTGSLASWIVERISTIDAASRDATKEDIAEVLRELSAVKAELARLRTEPDAGSGTTAPAVPGSRVSTEPA